MKSNYLILAFGTLLIFACNMDEDHFDVMPERDELALEGMGEAYESALQFNDSLTICSNNQLSCDSTTMFQYDAMFHQFNERFNFHHKVYSHNNVDDDHHHNNGQSVWHGNMRGHEDHGNDNHNNYEHNNETLEEMMHLRELHDDVHPQ